MIVSAARLHGRAASRAKFIDTAMALQCGGAASKREAAVGGQNNDDFFDPLPYLLPATLALSPGSDRPAITGKDD